MSIEIPERDGDGYLRSMDDWTLEIGKAMAGADDFEITDAMWEQIFKAREYYESENVVPPIRKFVKYRPHEADLKIWRPAQADRLRLISTNAIRGQTTAPTINTFRA